MICMSCGQHFFKSQFDDGKNCFNCMDVILEDEDFDLEVNTLLNPSGKVKARITEDYEDDSFGF